MVTLRDDELERFAKWSGDQLVTPGPNGGRIFKMEIPDDEYAKFLAATGRGPAFVHAPAPASQPAAPAPEPSQLTEAEQAGVKALADHYEREKLKADRAALTDEFCEAHYIDRLGRTMRINGKTVEQRAEEWAAAGKPKPGDKPAHPPTGLAKAIRFAGEHSASSAPPAPSEAKPKGLAGAFRFAGSKN